MSFNQILKNRWEVLSNWMSGTDTINLPNIPMQEFLELLDGEHIYNNMLWKFDINKHDIIGKSSWKPVMHKELVQEQSTGQGEEKLECFSNNVRYVQQFTYSVKNKISTTQVSYANQIPEPNPVQTFTVSMDLDTSHVIYNAPLFKTSNGYYSTPGYIEHKECKIIDEEEVLMYVTVYPEAENAKPDNLKNILNMYKCTNNYKDLVYNSDGTIKSITIVAN